MPSIAPTYSQRSRSLSSEHAGTDLVDGGQTVEDAEHESCVAVGVARDLHVERVHQHLIERVGAQRLRQLA